MLRSCASPRSAARRLRWANSIARSQDGVKVPEGFAVTAQAYRDALIAAGAWAYS
jgi:hypothetical protein